MIYRDREFAAGILPSGHPLDAEVAAMVSDVGKSSV